MTEKTILLNFRHLNIIGFVLNEEGIESINGIQPEDIVIVPDYIKHEGKVKINSFSLISRKNIGEKHD